ncbi:hypothetical protein [Halobacteriovorax marinus]|uniref:hypothetical protein n=1 Tax=Halobacteriovorax marinus TaxID=97084 RepID=UPI003A909552
MIAFIMSLSTVASTQKLNFAANCWINGGANAVCETCNFAYSRPIFCQMSIQGVTSRGFWFNGQQQGVVYPGQCISGYVYANNSYMDPLVNANANTNCRF